MNNGHRSEKKVNGFSLETREQKEWDAIVSVEIYPFTVNEQSLTGVSTAGAS